MKKNLLIYLCIGSFLFLESCLEDTTNVDEFPGPSEIYVEFQSGSFTGRSYNLISSSIVDDHTNIGGLIQKILCKPLEEKVQNNLATNSFVNWAWQGDTITGQFQAVFANDPNIPKSGDLQLIFKNGDEYISSIPKGTNVDVTGFGGPTGAIEGSLSFTAPLDYRLNGNSKRETASIYIGFKIKRGPDN